MSDHIDLYDSDGLRVGAFCVRTGRAQIGDMFLAVERTCRIVHPVDEFGDIGEVCSECGFGNMRDRFTAQPFRFCPRCGARVVVEE